MNPPRPFLFHPLLVPCMHTAGSILCAVGLERGQVKVFSLTVSLCWSNEFTLSVLLATELHQMSSVSGEWALTGMWLKFRSSCRQRGGHLHCTCSVGLALLCDWIKLRVCILMYKIIYDCLILWRKIFHDRLTTHNVRTCSINIGFWLLEVLVVYYYVVAQL